ncbi:Retrovirus-related Pol polyprotein from transposon RE1 [Vitis vinifera]|uniref:Retrovirus-related Pol polyprotein from transposon RE1 n=1 Tax=Vitis vinifera TaxID=29760 RepID=A0A438HF34_VITVI|nr:Retrovirus-related Pol polyprotein from transposon RE1 [Vitis vinifera]
MSCEAPVSGWRFPSHKYPLTLISYLLRAIVLQVEEMTYTNKRAFMRFNYPFCKVVIGNGNRLNISNIGHSTILLCTDNNVTVEFFTNGFVVKDQASKKTLLQGNLNYGLYKLSSLAPSRRYQDPNGNKLVGRTSLTIEVLCMSSALQLPNKAVLWHFRVSHPFALVHYDLWGPAPIVGVNVRVLQIDWEGEFQAFTNTLLPTTPISFLLLSPFSPPSELVPISDVIMSISSSVVAPIPTAQPLSSHVSHPCHPMTILVVKPTTIRVVLSLALSFVDPSKRNFVWKLTKALYGLKQAPWAWFTKLSLVLVKWGFSISQADTSMFVYYNNSVMIVVLVYVDDIIVTSSSSLIIEQLISSLNSCIALEDLGHFNFFLGIESMASPMAAGLVLSIVDSTKLEDPTLYRSLVGVF